MKWPELITAMDRKARQTMEQLEEAKVFELGLSRGECREAVVALAIRPWLPQRYGLGSGEVVGAGSDHLVWNQSGTRHPVLFVEQNRRQRIEPVEIAHSGELPRFVAAMDAPPLDLIPHAVYVARGRSFLRIRRLLPGKAAQNRNSARFPVGLFSFRATPRRRSSSIVPACRPRSPARGRFFKSIITSGTLHRHHVGDGSRRHSILELERSPRIGQTTYLLSIPRQRRLDAMQILDHGGDVDAFGAQIAMRNLVADLIEFHGPLPLVAAPVQHERQTVPETQPGVVRIVQAPRPTVPPFLLRLPRNG